MNLEDCIAKSKIAFMQGNYIVALEEAKQALSINQKSADAYQYAGNAYMSKDDYESCNKSLQESSEI